MSEKLKKFEFEYLGIPAIILILSPVLFLTLRYGVGSAIFVVHDQLDETIINYVFAARYFGANVYDKMMCGIPASSIAPFAPGFVILYKIFNVYTAFLIQHIIVIITAFFGMYACVKQTSKNNFAAFLSAILFAMLPVHSIYGNIVMGMPLLLWCVLKILKAEKKRNLIFPFFLLAYLALTTSLSLSGWAVLGIMLVLAIEESIRKKKVQAPLFIAFGILLGLYALLNKDLIINALTGAGFVSHRVEFDLKTVGVNFFVSLKNILLNGASEYEAVSKHEPIIIVAAIALIISAFNKNARKYLPLLGVLLGAILLTAVFYAFFNTTFFIRVQNLLPGMFTSFQFSRVYYFLPALWYVLFGISAAAIFEAFPKKAEALSLIIPGILFTAVLAFLIKDPDGIFHQNLVASLNNEKRAYYVSMKNLYAEDVMQEIEETIGEDIDTYRVAHLGMCPVASLIHGFGTIDGYSNNYPLVYKHEFREIIKDELELSEFNKAYFDDWGNRCYLLYHEWANSYMLSKYYQGSVDDLHLDFDKMKEMNCKYIFSAVPITDCEQYGLEFMGAFDSNISYWRVYLYKID